MLPLVAIFGPGTSDVLYTLVFAAADLSLLFLLFEQLRAVGLSHRSWRENAALALLLHFGAITLYLSLGGRMWLTGHIVCLGCTLAALLLAFRRRYAWSAAALGCAVFTRTPLVLAVPLILYLTWQDGGKEPLFWRFARSVAALRPNWRLVPVRRLAPVVAVMVSVGALMLLRNWAIFGSPFESGYGITLRQNYPEIQGGVFSLSYVPANVIADFFSFPRVIFNGPFDRHPALDMLNGGIMYHGVSGGVGTSVFLTTPLFLLLFVRSRPVPGGIRAMLWITVAAFVAEVLLFHATGWYQFGARYLFDAYPFAFVLLALSGGRLDWRWLALGAVGIVVNALGAYQFWTGHMPHL